MYAQVDKRMKPSIHGPGNSSPAHVSVKSHSTNRSRPNSVAYECRPDVYIASNPYEEMDMHGPGTRRTIEQVEIEKSLSLHSEKSDSSTPKAESSNIVREEGEYSITEPVPEKNIIDYQEEITTKF